MNIREYYSKEEDYTILELVDFHTNPNDTNRQKVLKKRKKFKEKTIREVEREINRLENLYELCYSFVDYRPRIDRLYHDLEYIRKVIVSDK